MKSNFKDLFLRYEKFIPIILFLLFFLITIPGIEWGAPEQWHPDEIAWRVFKALDGEMVFDSTEPDYNHPSLPKHIMYGVGWSVRELGGDETAMRVAMRLISVLLGGFTVVLVYFLTKLLSKNIYIPVLASFFLLTNKILAHHARFAHNDIYLLFFITFALFSLVKYRISGYRGWLYAASFLVGCAASSKYTGASFSLVVVVVFLIENWKTLFQDKLKTVEKIFISVGLAVLGYSIGTPKFLLWMVYYLKRMVPAALRQSVYSRTPDSLPGWVTQWRAFEGSVGTVFYYLFLFSFLWLLFQLIYGKYKKIVQNEQRNKGVVVILLATVIFNLPYLFAYHLQNRFFLPFVPMFIVLSSLFLEDLLLYSRKKGYKYAPIVIWGGSIAIILFSFVSIISIVLLFKNDSRIKAGEFAKTLEEDTHLEYTLYPPNIERDYFSVARNYPVHFIKYPGDEVPTNKPYKYNQGEAGLIDRGADYLIIDSFTYARCAIETVYESNPVECAFFDELLADETAYEMIGEFTYTLPPFLPQIRISFVNPEIQFFQKRE